MILLSQHLDNLVMFSVPRQGEELRHMEEKLIVYSHAAKIQGSCAAHSISQAQGFKPQTRTKGIVGIKKVKTEGPDAM